MLLNNIYNLKDHAHIWKKSVLYDSLSEESNTFHVLTWVSSKYRLTYKFVLAL